MGLYKRAAFAGVQEGGQAVEVSLPSVPGRIQDTIRTRLNFIQDRSCLAVCTDD